MTARSDAARRDRVLGAALRLDRSPEAVAEVRAAVEAGSPLAGAIWRWASTCAVTPSLYYYLRATGALARVEPTAAGWLEAEFERNAIHVATLRATAGKLSARLLERDIPVVWLKGLWLTGSAYELPGMRSMDDIDLLVPTSRFAEAERLMLEQGLERDRVAEFTGSSPHASPLRGRDERASGGSLLKVDLHHEVFPPEECAWATKLVWNEAVPADGGDAEVLVPASEAGILLIAVHLFKHHLAPKYRFKAIADVAALLRRHGDALDWERLRDAARAPFVAITLSLLFRVSGAGPLHRGAEALDEACRERLRQLGLERRMERMQAVATGMGTVRPYDASIASYGRQGSAVRALPALTARLVSRERMAKLRVRRSLADRPADRPDDRPADRPAAAAPLPRRLRDALPGSNWRYTLTTYLAGRLDHAVTRLDPRAGSGDPPLPGVSVSHSDSVKATGGPSPGRG